jgi:hypothetical protein
MRIYPIDKAVNNLVLGKRFCSENSQKKYDRKILSHIKALL